MPRRTFALIVLVMLFFSLSASADLSSSHALLKSGRAFVPVRAIFEWLGATVDYQDGQIIAERDSDTLTLDVDRRTATHNGEAMDLAAAPFVSGGRSYVPLRFVGESFGAQVGYDSSSRKVAVAYRGKGISLPVQVAGSPDIGRCTELSTFVKLLKPALAKGDTAALKKAYADPFGQYDPMTGDERRRMIESIEPLGTGLDWTGPEPGADYVQMCGNRPSDKILIVRYTDGRFGGLVYFLRRIDGYWRVAGAMTP